MLTNLRFRQVHLDFHTSEAIEDVIPLYNLELSLRVETPISVITLVPQGQTLPFTQTNGRITIRVPQVVGHQMIAVTPE